MAALRTRSLPGAPVPGFSTPVTFRAQLSDGLETTVHLSAHERARTALRVVVLPRPAPLLAWCARTGIRDALVGGFFVTSTGAALGDLRTAGIRRRSIPFTPPWSGVRASVHVAGGDIRIARREHLPTDPRGDFLQAGPLLVQDGAPVIEDGRDAEGFSAASEQFDSDITAGRHPRAALGVADELLLSVVCEGRAEDEAGLTLAELASLMAALGARDALNLDGGGSASLVCGGRLVNLPREQDGAEIPGGRPVVTALAFTALE